MRNYDHCAAHLLQDQQDSEPRPLSTLTAQRQVLHSHVGPLVPKSWEADVEVGQVNTVQTGGVSQLRKYQIVKSTLNKTAQTSPTGRHQLSILENKPFCSLLYFEIFCISKLLPNFIF